MNSQGPSRLRLELAALIAAVSAVVFNPVQIMAQTSGTQLSSRPELTAAAEQAERAAAMGSGSAKTRSALTAASIRQRLKEGDFHPGDRIVYSILADALRTDTLVVRAGRVLQLPGKIEIPLTGVLRSELENRVSTEVLKYIKAQQITVTPLMRIGVLGEVARPGYFALASDAPITDAIMAAGGPTGTADVERTLVRRGSQEFRSPDETRQAISHGLTIDQFGLTGGDELVVGKQRDLLHGPILGLVGAMASLTAVFVALHH